MTGAGLGRRKVAPLSRSVSQERSAGGQRMPEPPTSELANRFWDFGNYITGCSVGQAILFSLSLGTSKELKSGHDPHQGPDRRRRRPRRVDIREWSLDVPSLGESATTSCRPTTNDA